MTTFRIRRTFVERHFPQSYNFITDGYKRPRSPSNKFWLLIPTQAPRSRTTTKDEFAAFLEVAYVFRVQKIPL